MPRKPGRYLSVEQAQSNIARLDQVLAAGNTLAYRQFEIACRQHEVLLESRNADDVAAQFVARAMFTSTLACAALLWRDEHVRRRYVDLVAVHKALTLLVTSVVAQPVLLPGLRMHKVQGPRIGPRTMTPDEFAKVEPTMRQEWRESHHGAEPRDVDMWVGMGLSRRAYYRLKGSVQNSGTRS